MTGPEGKAEKPRLTGMLGRTIRHNLARLRSWLNVKYYRFMGIKIGKGVFVSRHAHIDVRRGKISIGNDVHIGGGSYVLSHAGFRPTKEGEETVIEDHVRIFVNCVIFPGIRIGKNSIVGAGAVVMKDVPSNVVVLGNPARVIQNLEENP
jgi:acetyltransferase-like isoleucine patch superfamily enzyme